MSKVVPSDKVRRYVVQVRLSELEYIILRKRAKITGCGMSELIRRALYDAHRNDFN